MSGNVDDEFTASGNTNVVLDDETLDPVHPGVTGSFVTRAPSSTALIELTTKLPRSICLFPSVDHLPVNLVRLRNIGLCLEDQASMFR